MAETSVTRELGLITTVIASPQCQTGVNYIREGKRIANTCYESDLARPWSRMIDRLRFMNRSRAFDQLHDDKQVAIGHMCLCWPISRAENDFSPFYISFGRKLSV
ncbi:hypothetical protein ANTRET_LOCUS4509 [Anthophora retusa]